MAVRIHRGPRVTGEHVVFLGAGASRAFGYALTSDILPEIVRRVHTGTFRYKELKSPKARQALQSTIAAVLPGIAPGVKLPLITQVLSLLDYCAINTENLSPGLDIEAARRLLELAIIDILDKPLHADAAIKPIDLANWGGPWTTVSLSLHHRECRNLRCTSCMDRSTGSSATGADTST